MKFTRTAAVSLAALAVTGVLLAATAQDKKPDASAQTDKKGPVFVSSDEAKFKEVIPGVSRAVLAGDPEKGAYAAFTKFAPGTTHAMHTHTSDLRLVVIKGAYIYKPEKGDEKRVGPGCFLSIPGGERHVSSGDAKEGALFYEEGSGKFDLVPVEKK